MLLSTAKNNSRIFGLDLLRALAILFVILGHGALILKKYIIVSDYYNFFVFDGVTIFFVLSGFLIGQILIKSLQKDEKFGIPGLFNFWKRRWYRTLPNYYLVLVIITFLNITFGSITLRDCIPFFFFSQNLAWANPNFFHEYWSLSVEEWFYLIIPVILILAFNYEKKLKGSIAFAFLIIVLITLIIRHYMYDSHNIQNIGQWDNLLRKIVITRLDSLMIGLLGAYLSIYYFRKWQQYKKPLLFIGIIMLIVHRLSFLLITDNLTFNPFLSYPLYYSNVSFLLISLGTLFLMPFLSECRIPSSPVTKVIATTSIVSYSMYLINLTLIQGTLLPISMKYIFYNISDLTTKMLLEYLLFWIYTLVGSAIIYRFFELPIMNYRDRVTNHE